MFTFMKKDILIMIRDRQELKILLVMPFVLTLILGFALKGVMSGESSTFHMNVAVVMEDEPSSAVQTFTEDLNQLPMPDGVKNELTEVAKTVQPVGILEQFLNSDEMTEMVETEWMSASEAEKALEEEDIVAILTVPEGFTYAFLQNLFLDQGNVGELVVTTGNHSSMSAGVFEDTIDMFVHSLNFETSINKVAGEEVEYSVDYESIGEVVTVTNEKPVSSTTYYAIGMAVMFALYVASTMTSKSYVENYQNVFSRILLSGKSPILYLSGKGLTTAMLVIIQLFLLFILSGIILQAFDILDPLFWLGALIVTLTFALSIGSIAMLLIAFTIRYNSVSLANVFAGGFVAIMALLGGSFAPTSQLPDIVGKLGEWTPNGIALSSLLQWSQGLGFEYITPLLLRLLIISLIFIVISYFIFPKREARA